MDRIKLITHKNPKSPISEAFRTLRTNIQFSNIDKSIKTLAVTSSRPTEGKTTICGNLACAVAQGDKRVLLIDCDMRKPRVHKAFGLTNLDGLTSILMGEKRLEDVAYKGDMELKTLTVITSGPIPPNPAELLGSRKMKEFLDDVKDQYDMVILDTPPVGLVTDGAILSTIVDGTILVVAANDTDVEIAISSKEQLEKVNANIIGVVLNKIPTKSKSYYNYMYYKYDDYYGDDLDDKKKKKRRRAK